MINAPNTTERAQSVLYELFSSITDESGGVDSAALSDLLHVLCAYPALLVGTINGYDADYINAAHATMIEAMERGASMRRQ